MIDIIMRGIVSNAKNIENIEEKLLHDVSSGGPIQRAFWNNVGKITSKSMFDNETVDNYFNNLAKIMSGGGFYDI